MPDTRPDGASAAGTESRPTASLARARLAAAASRSGKARGRAFTGDVIPFSLLCKPPAWAAVAPEEGNRLAAIAALLTVAPDLRTCIDGALLGPLADAFGDDTLTAVLDQPTTLKSSGLPPDAAVLQDAGADLLAAAKQGDTDAIALMEMAAAIAPIAPVAGATPAEGAEP